MTDKMSHSNVHLTTAPAPGAEMVEPYGGGTGFRFKIRNVKIDGRADVVHVRGGGSHEVTSSTDLCTSCPCPTPGPTSPE